MFKTYIFLEIHCKINSEFCYNRELGGGGGAVGRSTSTYYLATFFSPQNCMIMKEIGFKVGVPSSPWTRQSFLQDGPVEFSVMKKTQHMLHLLIFECLGTFMACDFTWQFFSSDLSWQSSCPSQKSLTWIHCCLFAQCFFCSPHFCKMRRAE